MKCHILLAYRPELCSKDSYVAFALHTYIYCYFNMPEHRNLLSEGNSTKWWPPIRIVHLDSQSLGMVVREFDFQTEVVVFKGPKVPGLCYLSEAVAPRCPEQAVCPHVAHRIYQPSKYRVRM